MYMSTEATEDILAVNKVLSLRIRDKLDRLLDTWMKPQEQNGDAVCFL